MIFSAELPFPPSVNHYWRRTGSGRNSRTYISAEGVKFTSDVSAICHALNVCSCTTERLRVSVVLHAPNLRKFDIDNRLKSLLDALCKAGVYADDEQVDEILIRRGEIRKGGSCFVQIETM